jgi:hypothetical protein
LERLIEPLRERGHGADRRRPALRRRGGRLDATADVAAGFLIEDDVIVVGIR